jgi:hypothetical protein
VLLEQIDDVIAQDNASEQEKVEFTPELLHSMATELNAALAVDHVMLRGINRQNRSENRPRIYSQVLIKKVKLKCCGI